MSQKQDFSYLDIIALEAQKWNDLSDQEFQMMFFRHTLFYGITKNRKLIINLFDMYEALMTRSSVSSRIKILTALASNIRKNHTGAHLAIFPFLQVEEDGEIIRTASHFFMNISAIKSKDYTPATNILVNLIKSQSKERNSAYIILGMLDTEQKTVMNMISSIKQSLGSGVISILKNNGVDNI